MMAERSQFCCIALLLVAFVIGCTSDSSPVCSNATNGCACAEGHYCLAGLVCINGVCRSGDAGEKYYGDALPSAGSGGGWSPPVDAARPDANDSAGAHDTIDSASAIDSTTNNQESGADSGGDISITDSSQDATVDQTVDSSIESGISSDAETLSCGAPRPVVFVHGVNGSSANYDTMIQRLTADGWPQEFIYRFDAADPTWGCNIDNAAAIQQLVERASAETGYDRIDLVAHSMGTLSSRYYVKNLGGHEVINTYVTLGGMHHGLLSPCWSPIGMQCTWDELCGDREFLTQLNADPATPGALFWVSIYGTADTTVPNDSSYLEGAENISLDGVTHSGPDGLLEHDAAYEEVVRVLSYTCW